MVIEQKNCVFDNECIFLKGTPDGYKCEHPQRKYQASYISVLFEKCPLKNEELLIIIDKESKK